MGVVAEGVRVDVIRRLAALLMQDDEDNILPAINTLSERWRLSNVETKRLQNALTRPDGVAELTVETSVQDARRSLYLLGEERYRDHVLLAWASYRHVYGVSGPKPGASGTATWDRLLRLPQTAPVPKFPLSGQDVLDAGLAPGPQVGEVLRELEENWIAEGFVSDREALLLKLTGVPV